MARREGLEWKQTDINHDTIPAGTVISQIPEADKPMQKGDSLLVTVSLGPVTNSMPDVLGLSYEDAVSRLTARGFGSTIATRTVSSTPAGTVLEQNPQVGAPYTPGQSVELTISGGSTMVPEVTDRTAEEAVTLLKESNLTTAKPVYVETTDPSQIGQVLAQSPASGAMAVIGAPVTLTIGMESQPYRGELNLTIPAADTDRVLRVTMLINGEEIPKYEGTVAAGSESVMLIPLSASTAGEMLCRIYLGGELHAEQTAVLR